MRFLSYQDLRERGISYTKMHLWRLVKAEVPAASKAK
jgi:hypothetical protein